MNDESRKMLPIVGTVFLLLTGIVLIAYQYSRPRGGVIVLPGGVTYLGPSPTKATSEKVPIPADVSWATQTGKKYPYSFSYPTTLSLGFFPSDPFDAVTIFWGKTNPQENLLLRVENLKEIKGKEAYIKKSKKDYALDWWKDYSWKGISDIAEFTNSRGLKGYRAKYLDASGSAPFDHIFFEVPGRPELVVWMTSKLLQPEVFDKIVDSLQWNSTN